MRPASSSQEFASRGERTISTGSGTLAQMSPLGKHHPYPEALAGPVFVFADVNAPEHGDVEAHGIPKGRRPKALESASRACASSSCLVRRALEADEKGGQQPIASSLSGRREQPRCSQPSD